MKKYLILLLFLNLISFKSNSFEFNRVTNAFRISKTNRDLILFFGCAYLYNTVGMLISNKNDKDWHIHYNIIISCCALTTLAFKIGKKYFNK